MIVKLENNGNGQYVYPIIMSLSSILHFIHLSPCRLLSYCPTSRASIQNGTWPLYRNRVSSHFDWHGYDFGLTQPYFGW